MRKIVSIAVVVLTVCRAFSTELDLAGVWTLSGANEGGDAVSCAAKVPGDVHSALFAAGLMKDPYFGRNEKDVQWVARGDWSFERTFDISEDLLRQKSVVLRLEDCDTFATVQQNGREIGRTSNRFRGWEFDAKKALKAGRNVLTLRFESAWRVGDALAAKAGRVHPMSCEDFAWFNNGAFIRKLAKMRHEDPIWSEGAMDWVTDGEKNGVIAFTRTLGARKVLVAANLSASEANGGSLVGPLAPYAYLIRPL